MSVDTQRLLQRALLGEAIDNADDVAVFVWNEERNYVAVNETACRLVGLGREELIGMPVGTMSADIETTLGEVKSGVTDGTISFTRRDGEVVELEWTTLPTKVAGLPYRVSICRRR